MTNHTDLVARLLLNVPCWEMDTCWDANGKKLRKPCGQDGGMCEECRKKQDAADIIESQAKDIARLREALTKIATYETLPNARTMICDYVPKTYTRDDGIRVTETRCARAELARSALERGE